MIFEDLKDDIDLECQLKLIDLTKFKTLSIFDIGFNNINSIDMFGRFNLKENLLNTGFAAHFIVLITIVQEELLATAWLNTVIITESDRILNSTKKQITRSNLVQIFTQLENVFAEDLHRMKQNSYGNF